MNLVNKNGFHQCSICGTHRPAFELQKVINTKAYDNVAKLSKSFICKDMDWCISKFTQNLKELLDDNE